MLELAGVISPLGSCFFAIEVKNAQEVIHKG